MFKTTLSTMSTIIEKIHQISWFMKLSTMLLQIAILALRGWESLSNHLQKVQYLSNQINYSVCLYQLMMVQMNFSLVQIIHFEQFLRQRLLFLTR